MLILTLLSDKKRAFLIADTTLLRKTGKSFDHIRKLYDPSLKEVIYAHEALVLILSAGNIRIPVHVELLVNKKSTQALIYALEKHLPVLKRLFSQPCIPLRCKADFKGAS